MYTYLSDTKQLHVWGKWIRHQICYVCVCVCVHVCVCVCLCVCVCMCVYVCVWACNFFFLLLTQKLTVIIISWSSTSPSGLQIHHFYKASARKCVHRHYWMTIIGSWNKGSNCTHPLNIYQNGQMWNTARTSQVRQSRELIIQRTPRPPPPLFFIFKDHP